MVGGRITDLSQAKRLERGLIWVRWFRVALGTYLTAYTNSGGPPYASRTVVVSGLFIMAALGVGNLIVWLATGRARSLASMRRVGIGAFALDSGVILGLTWLFTNRSNDPTWVILYILPLEGAIRYQLAGALSTLGVVLVNEVAREAYVAATYSRFGFVVADVAFRVGVHAIISLVAGFMARSLAREAQKAAEQARLSEEAARREAAARGELSAFNTAILTGVAAEDLDTSLQLMAESIGRELGFETLGILLREGEELTAKGMYGMPMYDKRISLGRGVTGTVAATGRPLLVPDVRAFPGYISGHPEMRSEMAAPMRIGEEVIGVLDVESRAIEAFDESSLESLSRLADQIALVAHSNQLLSQQRDTVARLRELDQMKSDFVAITSHELRTPLTAIRGFVKTLIRNRERMSDSQVAEFMRIIDRQSERLTHLVEDLLIASRIEAGAVDLSLKEVHLETFVSDLIASFQPADRHRIKPTVAGGTVVIDPSRVEQILRNLLDNALKFSPPDSAVSLRASVGVRAVELQVADAGVGIAPEDLPHIFDRFHQASDALTREAHGVGLGLFITKRLTEAMGGRIEASSTPAEGSTFTVVIPQGSPAEAAVSRPETGVSERVASA